MTSSRLILALTITMMSAAGVSTSGCDTTQTVGSDSWLSGPALVYLSGVRSDSAYVVVDGVVKSGPESPRGSVVPGPAVVQAGVPVEIEVHTLGTTPDNQQPLPSEVSVEGTTVRIAVRDSVRQGPVPLPLVFHPRTETVVFESAGEGRLLIEGIRSDTATPDPPYGYAIEIPITVRD